MGEAEDGIGLRQVVPDAENELVWKTFECRHRSHERSSLIIEGGVNIAASPKQSIRDRTVVSLSLSRLAVGCNNSLSEVMSEGEGERYSLKETRSMTAYH